jgi:hypothetical protein
MSENHDYQLVAGKRAWVPNWLFAIFAWPVDLIVIRWLPFRHIFTTAEPKIVRQIIYSPPLKPGQEPISKAIWIPVTVDKNTGEDLLTEEAIRRIDMCRIQMALEQLREAVRELTGFYK